MRVVPINVVSDQGPCISHAGIDMLVHMATYQAYMEGTVKGISDHPALLIAINKDTQELWFELVPFDAALAQRMSDRAVKVITATEAGELLPRAFAQASHFECKFCSYAQRCWGGAL